MENITLKTLSMMGVNISFLASGKHTDGAWSLMDYTAPPEFPGPAPHYHKVTMEAFYILEGQLSLKIDGVLTEAKPGQLVIAPPGTVHVWRNPHADPCRFLILFSPSGMEGYFEELATLMREETTWPPQDMTRVTALAEKYDTFSPSAG
jgi:mannose-6-phosphate isomerase-like protein (cupin superfamily)